MMIFMMIFYTFMIMIFYTVIEQDSQDSQIGSQTVAHVPAVVISQCQVGHESPRERFMGGKMGCWKGRFF